MLITFKFVGFFWPISLLISTSDLVCDPSKHNHSLLQYHQQVETSVIYILHYCNFFNETIFLVFAVLLNSVLLNQQVA